LSKMVVGGINFPPSSGSGSPDVQLQLSAEQPLVLYGYVQDSDMRRVLTYVVENGERFDAGVRLDCLEALKAVSRDQQVRQALIDALEHDSNPGVRVEAVNVLVGSLQHGQSEEMAADATTAVQADRPEEAQSVERVVRALEQLQHRDPSRYVRLRSAAALRQIGPREVQ